MADQKERLDAQAESGFGQVLELLAGQKDLSPQMFMAALSLANLLGIVNYLNTAGEPPSYSGSARSSSEKQVLTNTLLSLLASSEGQGNNKDALLSTLMGALGGSGGKKLDPSTLLSLAGSLAGQMEKGPAAPAQYATDQQGSLKGQQAEVRELNARRG